MNSRKDLTTGVVWKKLLLFFLPIAAGTCIQQLYNTVDGLIVSKFVGTTALAAVGGSSAQIINLLIGIFVAITAGASVVIAQLYGANRDDEVQKAMGNSIVISVIAGIVLAFVGIVLSPWMLKLLKTPDDTIGESIIYLRIYFSGVPFIMLLNMESNILRSVGDSTNPFIYMVISCVSNIVLDILFVVVFNWGVAGVAIATVLAQIINTTLLTLKLVFTKKTYKLNFHFFTIKGKYLGKMLKIGVPAGLQSLMYAVSNMLIQVGVNTLGTIVVASWAMTSKIDGVFWAISSALGVAITSFIGQNVGAKKEDRVNKCVKQGTIMCFCFTIFLSALIMFTAKPLLPLFTDSVEVIDTTYEMITYFVPYYFTWVLIEVLSGVLRGAGDAIRPVIILGLCICLFRIIWLYTLFAYFRTLFSLCFSYTASWIFTSVVMIIYYKKSNWRKRAYALVN